jgi:hypothetical protein
VETLLMAVAAKGLVPVRAEMEEVKAGTISAHAGHLRSSRCRPLAGLRR